MKKVVTIGGGSGHSQVLKALRDIPDIEITAICPSTDSGGSTGLLKENYDGSGYLGDLTKCIVALCKNEIISKALNFRYKDGPLHSHSVKNLLFHALEKTEPKNALEAMWDICDLGVHKVIPVTKDKTELCATLKIGNKIFGETNIDRLAVNPLWNPHVHSIKDIFLKPRVKASKETLKAIREADHIIICPGDLYSSIIPVLLPDGVRQTIEKSKSQLTFILNIMTKKGETHSYTAEDFIKQIEKRTTRKADKIICNNSPIPKKALLSYSLEDKVRLGDLRDKKDKRIIFAPIAMVNEDNQILSNPETIKKALLKIL